MNKLLPGTIAQEDVSKAALSIDALKARNEELQKLVEARTVELSQSLEKLKETQQQLFHSEKMASLGELTAGIAHEIQNPLNFVNNFSEVSAELLDELQEELQKGAIEEAVAIAADLKDNLQKINHHGKRADSIVKGMLQHSRTNTGQKVLTDINALLDEYLRLSYHGLRAKDKSFNATLETNFASELEKIEVNAQDLGRVFLNLFNNAFYALQQKQAVSGDSYRPTVSVQTRKLEKEILIIVRDNGTGIPENIKAKILQPFFTTKPTGHGTGLGLSISYDVVTNGHGGELSIETKENEYSEFKVKLPISH